MTHPIVETARTWVKTPYEHKGRRPNRVLDCLGLVLCAAQAHGLTFDDSTDYYPGFIDTELLLSKVQQYLEPEDREDMDCLVLVQFREDGPTHFAFATDRGTLLHAKEGVGVVEVTYTRSWKNRTTHRFRLPPL